MKKIFIALTFILAFSLSSNAQVVKTAKVEKKEVVSPEVAAKNDAGQLSKLLSLDETMTDNFYRLFEMKYNTLQNDLTAERKTELSRVIEAKIRATLNDDSMKKLEKNEELFKRLIN